MKVNYNYATPSMCIVNQGNTTLGLSPDLSRDEKVSFHGKLKNPLIFRDAMLMLREIVVSDSSVKKKERVEFFRWLDMEIEQRINSHEKYMPDIREELKNNRQVLLDKRKVFESDISKLQKVKADIQKELDNYDVWKDYYQIERKFWQFLRERDVDLWFVLDPVITVHPDQVSFEAFSVDESIYGCLSIDMDEFELLSEPKLGTTNIDFSAKLAKEMERFRTYSNVELSVNPEGFIVDTGIMPEHVEKKIDLPETWIKGFNQVSSASNLKGISLEISPVDMYDICSFLRRNKENKSPRYMKWILEKNKPIRILFEPFGKEIILKSIYTGNKNREEKIWGRRRWLVAEKLIPIAESFEIKLLGFGMPQFIIGNLGKMKMTIGFSSWSSNDWVKGTAFNIMNGFIGEGNYDEIYSLLKEKRYLAVNDILDNLKENPKSENISGIGSLLKRGEAYYDTAKDVIRFRKLCSEPIPKELYETTNIEYNVKYLLDLGMENFKISLNQNNDFVFKNIYEDTATEITIDDDGQINNLKCRCRTFNSGPRNISAPCEHILALYIISAKFTKLELEQDKEYKINDIMEMLL